MKKVSEGSILIIILIVAVLAGSCKKDYPAPEVDFDYSVKGNRVEFNAELSNAVSFVWNFGDDLFAENDTNPVHTYEIYGRDYTVILSAEGRGGKTDVSKTITVPPMTSMEKLSGDSSFPDGKKWRISKSADIIRAKATESMASEEIMSPAEMTSIGLNSLYDDQFIFRSNGDFIIIPGESIVAGLGYCTFRQIENHCPSTEAFNHNLTLVESYIANEGLTYGFTELKDFALQVTGDGISSEYITYHDVQTVSLSYGAFLGIMDFLKEYIILDLTADTMKIACFCSSTALHNAADYVMILTLEPAQ